MTRRFYEQPIPALGLAVGATVVVHNANANAARALRIPPVAVGLLVALLIALASLTELLAAHARGDPVPLLA